MPLIKSGSKEAFKSNVRTLMHDVGKSPHVQSRDQALAVAYATKRANRADGGGVHEGPINSAVPGRTDHHPMDVAAGSYVLPADHVSSLGEGNTQAGMAILNHMFSHPHYKGANPHPANRKKGGRTDDHIGEPVPINAAGGEFVIPPEIVKIIGDGDIKKGHEKLDNWVIENRKLHRKTLGKLPGPAKD